MQDTPQTRGQFPEGQRHALRDDYERRSAPGQAERADGAPRAARSALDGRGDQVVDQPLAVDELHRQGHLVLVDDRLGARACWSSGRSTKTSTCTRSSPRADDAGGDDRGGRPWSASAARFLEHRRRACRTPRGSRRSSAPAPPAGPRRGSRSRRTAPARRRARPRPGRPGRRSRRRRVVAGDPHPRVAATRPAATSAEPGQQPASGRQPRSRGAARRTGRSRRRRLAVAARAPGCRRAPARRPAAGSLGGPSSTAASSAGCSASYAARASGSSSTFAARLSASKRRSPGSRSAIWAFQAARISSVEASRGTSRTSYQVGASLTACSPRSVPASAPSAPVTGEKSSTSHSPSITTRSTVKRNGSGSWSTVCASSPCPARSCR